MIKKPPPFTTAIKNLDYITYGKNILFALGATFVLTSFFSILFQKLDIATFQLVESDAGKLDKSFVYACIVAPFIEEFIFRWLPISFAMKFCKGFEKWKWYFAALLSIIFGFSHYGYFSIYIQGVLGFFITYVYYNNRRYMYLCGVVTHMAWNFSLAWALPTMIHFPKIVPFF